MNILAALLRPAITLLSKARQPRVTGRVRLNGLDGDVEIIRDRWGVPHIYASTERDLFFAQGFTHAQDRMWQMDLSRRLASGRAAEAAGRALIETDRIARALGFRRTAQIDLENLPEDVLAILTAYAAGANAHISGAGGRLPVEFTLLRYRPGPWTVLDSLTYARMLTWLLSYGWFTELVKVQLIEKLGPDRAADLAIAYPPGHALTLPDGIEVRDLPASDEHARRFVTSGGGSNAWAVSGSRTPTGAALLANDPHLPLRLPSTWYENHLAAPTYHVTGASFPGLPGVAIGHNERIAWGITVSFVDAQDVVIERFAPGRPRRYEYDGRWLEAEATREEIRVRGRKEPVFEEVLVTHNGPVIPQLDVGDGKAAAIRAGSLGPAQDVAGFLGINRARNWTEFRESCRLLRATQINLVYADVDGNIGYAATGAIPVRRSGDGTLPAPGWSADSDVIGEVPFDEMPHALNPAQGYIASANNRMTGGNFPHFLGAMWIPGYRANRIETVISSADSMGVAESKSLQNDLTCLPGLELAAALQSDDFDHPDAKTAAALLRDWDGRLAAETAAGAVYEVLRRRLLHALVAPVLGPDLTRRIMGEGTHPLLAGENEYVVYDTTLVLRLLERRDGKDSWWVEQAGGRKALLERVLIESMKYLRDTLGEDPSRWRWGDMHTVTFEHAIGLRPPFDAVFNRGPYPVGGDSDTPWQMAFPANGDFSGTAAGQSYRQIIDMGDLANAVAILPPGQSGRLGSKHYDDLIQPWLDGLYHPMLWTRPDIDRHAGSTLTLTP